jgi:alcohol dehydrogenase class IV
VSELPLPQSIKLASNALVGSGASSAAVEWISSVTSGPVGVLVDEAVVDQPGVVALVDSLAHRSWVVHSRSGTEPDYEYLDAVASEFRESPPELIVGIGGGSTLDLAKGVGILLRNEGPGIAYRGVDLVGRPGVPVVCVPTTAGSGSETTATASFIDLTTRTKLGINGRHVGPALAVLDPDLLIGSPRSVTVGSGLDALVHAIEAVTAKSANTLSSLLGREAARLLFAALPRAVDASDDRDARTGTLLGAHLAGLAMQNAAGGPASGISYPIGVHHGVPHGYAGGVLLPYVVSANALTGWDGYKSLAAAVGVDDFPRALVKLYERIGAPRTFSAWGIDPGAVDHLVELTLAERRENLELNPAPFGRDEVRRLLEATTRQEGTPCQAGS